MMENRRSLKVLIADDHTLYRQAIANIVTGIEGVGQVLEATNGEEVLDMLISHKPVDVLFLDLQMPVMGGIEVCRYMAKHHPEVKIIVLSMLVTPYNCNQLLLQGAHICLS